MLDTLTLDQLRAFIAAADEGNFSAAARKLRRVQSAVSQSIANLELSLGVTLWDRSTKIPTLTAEGRALLIAARRVCDEADALRKLAAGMVTGIEVSVSLCVDAHFPLSALVELCEDITKKFPSVDLRVDTQPSSAVHGCVLSGSATLGVVQASGIPLGLESRILAPLRMVPVVSVEHPLARHEGRIPAARFTEHVQIVLAELLGEREPDPAILSRRTFSVADLSTKHAFIRAGLGWGNLPEYLIQKDLRARRLTRIRPEPWGEDHFKLYLAVVYRPDTAFGPVHRWMLGELETLCPRDATLGRAKRRG